jgi:hypothetical protein
MQLERWKRFTLRQQVGHITSEVTQARIWEEKNDLRGRNESLQRALKLIDLTIDCQSETRRRELTRLREVVLGHLSESKRYRVTLSQLQQYGLEMV